MSTLETIRGSEPLNESQFAHAMNNLRKANKGKWVAWLGCVNGKSVRLKFFELYIQIFDIDGVRYGKSSDCSSVSAWVDHLHDSFNT